MKERSEVIAEFNELVNMTASDLESWLKSDDSNSAGWRKDDGDGGETVGHDSGRKIVEILRTNPGGKEDEYSDEQVAHMRKVVSYCKRHLAQEKAGNDEKSEEEVKKTRSYASLKNWGHDALKARGSGSKGKSDESGKSEPKSRSKAAEKRADEGVDEDDNDEDAEDDAADDEDEVDVDETEGDGGGEYTTDEDADDEGRSQTGQKRKRRSGQMGPEKQQQVRKGEAKKKEDEGDEEDGEEETVSDHEDNSDEKQVTSKKGAKKQHSDSAKDRRPSKGDKVSWKWGGSHPEGEVLDVKEGDASITTKKGNKVSRKGTADDPAVILDAGKSKAIKKAHELD